jgi:hypothetical protein
MKLKAPKLYSWIAGVAIGVIGVIGHYVSIPLLTRYNFWVVVLGLVVLAVATVSKGL